MRFIHTADWQLGARQHPKIYREKMLGKLVSFANENRIKHIFCIGDIFDHEKPDQKTKDYLLQTIVSEDAKELIWHFTIGNHDFETKARTYHSLQTLKILNGKLENVHVYEYGFHPISDEFELVVLPEESVFTEEFPKKKAQYRIGTFHGILPGVVVSSLKDVGLSKAVKRFMEKNELDYFALGDIHQPIQPSERCWYPGALVQKTYGCTPGFVVVELEGEEITTTKHTLDLPKKISMKLTFEEGKDSEESIIQFLKKEIPEGHMVRIVFSIPVDIYASLDKTYIKKSVKDRFLELKIDNDPISSTKKRENTEEMSKAKTLEEEVNILIEEDSFGVEEDVLKKYCRKYTG